MAAFTGDLLALLDKIPIWRRVQEAPGRLDALEKRVAALEARLARAPGQACPSCGAAEFRVSATQPHPELGDFGAKNVTRTCGACSFEDVELVTPR